MSLTEKQTSRYWREWSAFCRAQSIPACEREDARRDLHRRAGCPASMRDFGNKDFDKYLREVSDLQGKVDIRDRERERVETVVIRLGAALREITGKDFARGIVADMNDRIEPLDLPLDPIADQAARGETHFRPDLSNLKNTLKNRLSKFLTKIKRGEIDCPPGREWWPLSANNPVIDAIAAGKICIRAAKSYRFLTPAEYAQKPGPNVTLGEPWKEPKMPDIDRPGRRRRHVDVHGVTDAAKALAAACGSSVEIDDDMPF